MSHLSRIAAEAQRDLENGDFTPAGHRAQLSAEPDGAARDARIAALEAQIAAVRALHTPETHYHQAIPWDPHGGDGSCDHCDAPLRGADGRLTADHFQDELDILRCRVRPLRTCAHCIIQEEEAPWPCATEELLQEP